MNPKALACRMTIVGAMLTVACGRRETTAGPTAGPAGTQATKASPPRVAKSGEVLLDLQRSSIKLTIVKDHDATTPVVATMALRDGVLALGEPALSSGRISFDLGTFESGVPMRNERVKQFFFETSAKDTAELVMRPLPESALVGLRDKKPVLHAKLDGDLTLHQRTARVLLAVDLGVLPTGTIWVKTTKLYTWFKRR